MSSLLGQFFSRIKGSQEDIASKGLVYILNSSELARKILKNYIFDRTEINIGEVNYLTQSIGSKLERPDISGIDVDGKERIIMEAKFWASLTKNQPTEYLNRLNENSVLLFICPKLREVALLNELKFRLENNELSIKTYENGIQVDNNKSIIITNWTFLLNHLKNTLNDNNEKLLVSDVDQLIGFCEIIDNSSFLPINETDLSPSIAKRINSYYDLCDKVFDKLLTIYNFNTSGNKATGLRNGYARYFTIDNNGMGFVLNMKFWEKYYDTPFWYFVKEGWYEQSVEFKKKLSQIAIKLKLRTIEYENILYFAIFPDVDEVEEVLLNKVVNIIQNIIMEING
jgi:hypothetical protein